MSTLVSFTPPDLPPLLPLSPDNIPVLVHERLLEPYVTGGGPRFRISLYDPGVEDRGWKAVRYVLEKLHKHRARSVFTGQDVWVPTAWPMEGDATLRRVIDHVTRPLVEWGPVERQRLKGYQLSFIAFDARNLQRYVDDRTMTGPELHALLRYRSPSCSRSITGTTFVILRGRRRSKFRVRGLPPALLRTKPLSVLKSGKRKQRTKMIVYPSTMSGDLSDKN